MTLARKSKIRSVCILTFFAAFVFARAGQSEALFPELSERILQQQFGRSVQSIQIAPTNEYSGAIHRIFQLAANICDSQSTNETPLVFRPLFRTNETGMWLDGFIADNDANAVDAWLASNPHDVPLVIAARKGLPSFNEFTLQTDLLVTRKLNLTRPNTNSLPTATNQMFLLSLSNLVAAESWNSYRADYLRPFEITISNCTTVRITNELGLLYETNLNFVVTTNGSAWPGLQFLLPLLAQPIVLPGSVYYFSSNRFVPVPTNQFELSASLTPPYSLPEPKWVVTLSNHLVYRLIDAATGRLMDFATLRDGTSVDVYRDLLCGNPAGGSAVAGVWSTNKLFGANGPTEGVRAQISVSAGNTPYANIPSSIWNSYGQIVNDKEGAIDYFRSFLKLGARPGRPLVPNTNLSVETPFNPIARLVHVSTLQANDPLVHYHRDDLRVYPSNQFSQIIRPPRTSVVTNLPPASLGQINDGYLPWGQGDVRRVADPNQYTASLRDAGVYSPDYWNFPRGEPLIPSLGRIHRGTPWQTIYLKAEAAPFSSWLQQNFSSLNHPTNDWRLATMLADWLGTNDPARQISVNSLDTRLWTNALNGLLVLSNDIPSASLIREMQPSFQTFSVTADSPQLDVLLSAIATPRSRQTQGRFSDVSAIFATPELSTLSPWLNTEPEQRRYGITDEAYEILPAQLLDILRASPIATVSRDGGSLVVYFNGCSGQEYAIEKSGDALTWTSAGANQLPTNGVIVVTVPLNATQQFLRARLVR